MRGRRPKIAAAAGLLTATLSFAHWTLGDASIVRSEEHFRIGERLHDEGTLSMAGAPSVFRAPGFAIFVAAVLHARDVLAPGLDGARAVVLAHGWLLAFAAVAVFAHVARERPVAPALGAGALIAVHPLSLAGATVLDYATLHILFVTLSTLALCRALRMHASGARRKGAWAVAAGLLWGATTLVRPLSLILPPFVVPLAWWTAGRGLRRALGFSALFTMGMALAIAPWTARNWRVTGRFIPVNAQEGFALWGLSATRDPAGGETEWEALWKAADAPLFAAATGRPYSLDAIHAHTVAANDAFRAAALRNIRESPGRYARNVLETAVVFNFVPTASIYVQPSKAGEAALFATLCLGLLGLVRGLRAGRIEAHAIAAVYAMFVTAHAIGFVLPRYTYVRLPLAVLAAPMAFRGRRGPLVAAIAAAAASIVEVPPGARVDAPVTRAEAAMVLLQSVEGPAYVPPPCATARFPDVRCANRYAPWINEAVARAVAAGCGGGYYCPDVPVTRGQMAVFVLRTREGPGYVPPPCSTATFTDAPCGSLYARWVEALAGDGGVTGCGGADFCPDAPLTRKEMPAFAAAARRE